MKTALTILLTLLVAGCGLYIYNRIKAKNKETQRTAYLVEKYAEEERIRDKYGQDVIIN